MSDVDLEALVRTAESAADVAGDVLRRYFRADLTLEGKDAPSPVVTIADRESEEAMRAAITGAFPDHTIIGEEFGTADGDGPVTWVLDPLDGTIAFVCGRPSFVELIAAYEGGRPLLGLIDQPVMRERWLGVAGAPTRLNGVPCRASGITELAEARLATTDPVYFGDSANGAWFEKLRGEVRLVSLGGDGYSYGLVASGTIDLLIESGLAWHDAAALIPVIEGAGGCLTDFAGTPLKPGQDKYDVIAAASRPLLEAALGLRG